MLLFALERFLAAHYTCTVTAIQCTSFFLRLTFRSPFNSNGGESLFLFPRHSMRCNLVAGSECLRRRGYREGCLGDFLQAQFRLPLNETHRVC